MGANNKKLTTAEFIDEARKIHGDRYDYSATEYKNTNSAVNFVCNTCHDVVSTPARSHLHKQVGCQTCFRKDTNRLTRRTQEQFITEARAIHGDKYSYDKSVYKSCNDPITIMCPRHGDFTKTAGDHIQASQKGCRRCYHESRTKYTQDQFIEKCKTVHDDKYSYTEVIFETTASVVKIRCPEHGPFNQIAHGHLRGQRCPQCALIHLSEVRLDSLEDFLGKVRAVWEDDMFSYEDTVYKGNRFPVTVRCLKHNILFDTHPSSTLLKGGNSCPKCRKTGFSKKAIAWLERVATQENVVIQHAQNGGEYCIPGTNFRVDGYHKESNTVYEFGAYYHADPRVYDPSEYNELCKATMEDLYIKTKKRVQKLKDLGYTIVEMWEYDDEINPLRPSNRDRLQVPAIEVRV